MPSFRNALICFLKSGMFRKSAMSRKSSSVKVLAGGLFCLKISHAFFHTSKKIMTNKGLKDYI